MDIQKEIYQRALELRAHAPIDGESRARDFGGALQVENVQLGTQVPVSLGFEIELRGLPPAPDLDIVRRGLSHWHGLVGDVGNARQQTAERFVQSLYFFIEGGHAVAQGPGLLLKLSSIQTLAFKLADRGALAVPLRLKLLGFGDSRAPLGIQFAKLRDVELKAARSKPLGYSVEVVSKMRQIMHGWCGVGNPARSRLSAG